MEENKKMEKRQVEFDIAKGIGIILVVWAHAEGPFSKYINGFHMPFFFFISGMLYLNKGRSIKDYTLQKCKTLLIPFWWWNLIFYPIFFTLYYWEKWSLLTAIKGIGEIVLTLNKVPFLGATWFLPALFWVSVFVHIFMTLFDKKKYTDIILLIVGIALAVVGFVVTLPYKISRNLICTLFYISGYLYRKYVAMYIKYTANSWVAIICIIVYAFCVRINAFNMGSNFYEHRILFVFGAFLAIYFWLWFSQSLAQFPIGTNKFIVKHIMFLGANSIDLVIWQFLAFRITIIFQIIIMGAGISSLTAFPVYDASGIWWFGYLLTGIYGSLLWKYILEHNPLSGRMKKICIIR